MSNLQSGGFFFRGKVRGRKRGREKISLGFVEKGGGGPDRRLYCELHQYLSVPCYDGNLCTYDTCLFTPISKPIFRPLPFIAFSWVIFKCHEKLNWTLAGHFNPLSPDIKMHILITDLHTFLMKLVRRICLNIKTSHPQWSLPLFSSLEYSNK